MILLTFLIGIALIFCIARYNESNKLFWILLISLFAGFTGGTIAAKLVNNKKNSKEKQELTQTGPIQVSQVATVDLLSSTPFDTKGTYVPTPVGQVTSVRDSKLAYVPGKCSGGEYIQQINYFDTS